MDAMPEYRNVDRRTLSLDTLTREAPAVFAETPDGTRTTKHYTFISTAQVVAALREAGFEPTRAQQTRVRNGGSTTHARHMLRFSHTRESLTLVDAIPELVLINSHDGTSAYTLRAGLYRPVCTNGLLAQIGDFGLIHVPHRGDIVANVVEGALAITRGFADIGAVVEQMHAKQLDERQRWDFAAQALSVRYHRLDHHAPITADQALLPRRHTDFGNSLWTTYNIVQENLCRGGVIGKTAKGRSTRTRAIRAIREDIRINAELWQHAMTLLRS
jgi:hypothetical protein